MKKQYISKSIAAALVIIFLLAAAIPALGASAKERVFVEFAPGIEDIEKSRTVRRDAVEIMNCG